GISDLITQSGLVNVDFADVKTVMANMGRALMGTGCAKGTGRARLAAETAVNSPLLDDLSVEGAMGVLINIVGGPDMKMKEIEEAASYIQEQAHEDANIIFGAAVDENMGDMMKVTVIATGFDRQVDEMHPATQVRTTPAQHLQNHPAMGSASHSHGHPHAHTMRGDLHAAMERGERPSMRDPGYEREQRFERAPMSSSVPSGRQSARQVPQNEEAPAVPTRRAPARELGASGRERASFVPPLDADWDTPAFQRRGN
ncbi:MAG: cell division protein FtsZ, partial [Polyangiaceae bacterium]|nr:cell division protein FtsZ [Polyangiaceae bacterium]